MKPANLRFFKDIVHDYAKEKYGINKDKIGKILIDFDIKIFLNDGDIITTSIETALKFYKVYERARLQKLFSDIVNS